MELLVSLCLGLLVACGVYLMLRARTFPVVVGLTMIGYAVNMFLFFRVAFTAIFPRSFPRTGSPMLTHCPRRSC